MAKAMHRVFNGERFLQFGSAPLHDHEKMDAERRSREGARIRFRQIAGVGLVAFIHQDEINHLRAERDSEIAYSMATGFGDHAKIARLDAVIAAFPIP